MLCNKLFSNNNKYLKEIPAHHVHGKIIHNSKENSGVLRWMNG